MTVPATNAPEPNETDSTTPILSSRESGAPRQLRAHELRDRAAALMRVHRPDREPWSWTRRWRFLPWPHRRGATCTSCRQAWPCPPLLVAERLASASRLLLAQLTVEPGNQCAGNHRAANQLRDNLPDRKGP